MPSQLPRRLLQSIVLASLYLLVLNQYGQRFGVSSLFVGAIGYTAGVISETNLNRDGDFVPVTLLPYWAGLIIAFVTAPLSFIYLVSHSSLMWNIWTYVTACAGGLLMVIFTVYKHGRSQKR